MANSYIIWFINGTYTVAWGSSPEDAREKYLTNWAKSIREVVPTSTYRNPLPNHLYISCPVMSVDAEPTIHAPLDQPAAPTLHGDLADLKAQVAALTAAIKKEPADEG